MTLVSQKGQKLLPTLPGVQARRALGSWTVLVRVPVDSIELTLRAKRTTLPNQKNSEWKKRKEKNRHSTTEYSERRTKYNNKSVKYRRQQGINSNSEQKRRIETHFIDWRPYGKNYLQFGKPRCHLLYQRRSFVKCTLQTLLMHNLSKMENDNIDDSISMELGDSETDKKIFTSRHIEARSEMLNKNSSQTARALSTELERLNSPRRVLQPTSSESQPPTHMYRQIISKVMYSLLTRLQIRI